VFVDVPVEVLVDVEVPPDVLVPVEVLVPAEVDVPVPPDVDVLVDVPCMHGPWLKLNWPDQLELITAVAEVTVLPRFAVVV